VRYRVYNRRENSEAFQRYIGRYIRSEFRRDGAGVMDRHVAVTLFRHGVTEENLERKYVGWSDPPITGDAGRTLRLLRSDIPSYDFCVSSDLTRCRQTADILFRGSQHVESEAFREMNFGQWELKTYADLCQDEAYQNWLDDPFSKRPPDGESFTDMEKRAMSGWVS